MIGRISELRPDLERVFSERGLEVEVRSGMLVIGGTCIIDWRETTGPVTEKHLRSWVADLEGYALRVLMAMGRFSPKAVRCYLAEPDIRKTVVLVEMGLRNYFEERQRPRVFAHDVNGEIVDALAEVFRSRDMVLEAGSCAHCDGKALACCAHCLATLCKTHVLICPICRERFCHTDVSGKDCFREHACGAPR